MFRILGPGHFQKWTDNGRIGHPESYWREHDIWLDCRGPLSVHSSSVWGYNVIVVTASHSLKPEDDFKHIFWPVIVEAGTWICSGAFLYNCRIGEGAVVAAGAVIRSRDVPAYTIVEGNPIQIVAKKNEITDEWIHLPRPEPIPTHQEKPSGRIPGFMKDHEKW